MNPSEKGWVREFLEERKESFLFSINHKVKGQNPDQSFYGLIQPTGLMYGFPISAIDDLHQKNWDHEDKVKVILLDTFINIAELYNYSSENIDYWEFMEATMKKVNSFYNNVYPEIATSGRNWFGRAKDTFRITERVLEKRVDMAFRKSMGNFWAEFFYNTQLFHDVYIFGQWSYTNPDKVLADFFKDQKTDLSYTAVKVMAAAAHANHKVEEEERKLFQHFIENTTLPLEKRRVAKEYFDHGLGIQDIPLEKSDPWIIRKFFLELAILTVWSDKKVDQIELEFLNRFNNSLGFQSADFEHSMIAVEGFVLENWRQLDALQSKKEYEEVSDEYIQRISQVVEKYKNRVSSAIFADEILVRLIKKGVQAELTDAEKEIMRDGLVQALKQIPSFRVIAFPKEFISFKILLRIIPREVIKGVLQLAI
ncbi:TerB family tellurite resistance protein [Fulvivirga sediminis]|uniref:TerB family tellurite resistance protein n=1 Tax=Fulvivirga sediminis TaxID=2803949 RepID=A0A937F4B8_9BACT|nr:TerB family tellurite resistance protein [Fulvivirga sediminis]MBL3654637.1 TerB family tellurite resistance protein [Fulvivirga sediminis]